MRIISGRLGSRNFDAPKGHRTHPMSDKMRGALFNMLGDITDMTVFDPFAGSGALSFEAISRGARSAIAIEADRPAQRVIAENIKTLGLADSVKLITAKNSAWLRTTDDTFDVVLLDPPYDDIQITLLEQLAQRVTPNGVVALSWPGKQAPPQMTGLALQRQNHYGDSSLYLFTR